MPASNKAPATAPVSRRALGAADENAPAPGEPARRPAMDAVTEAKKLRELCVLLRAELAAQRTKVASSALDYGVLSQSPIVCSLSFPSWLSTWVLPEVYAAVQVGRDVINRSHSRM